MKLIKETYLNILLEENELQRYDNNYFTINDDILNEEILENHSKILLILFWFTTKNLICLLLNLFCYYKNIKILTAA